jgi:hypothetical protein
VIGRAALYGCWSALLAFVTFAIANGYGMLSLGATDFLLGLLSIQILPAAATFVVGFLGWILLHLTKRHPGWIGYSCLAFGVVVVTQSLLSLPIVLFAPALDPIQFIRIAGGVLALHGWFSVPIALAGTAMFVRWLERGAKAPPSRPGRAGWRS